MANDANFQYLLKAIADKGSTLSGAQRDILVGVIRQGQRTHLPPYPAYIVLVHYDKTIEKLIKSGNYNWVNEDITSRHFPSIERGVAEVLVYLVSFNFVISSEDAVKELDRQGLRPATLKELLALGVTQPDLQRSNPIVALGSTWHRTDDCGVEVPNLRGNETSRFLNLRWWDGNWYPCYQFAAVSK